jgi:opacity protein-like surface antigen
MFRQLLTLSAVMLAFGALSAQEAISHHSLFAVGELTAKWTYRAETHFVLGDFMKQSRQLILRPAFIYKLSKSIHLSGGISYLYNASYEGGPFNTNEEINFWEQIDFSHQLGPIRLSHWLRHEQRHRENGYVERLRIRSRADAFLFEVNNTPVDLVTFNEHFVVTQGLNWQKMDQNWSFVGVQFPVNKHFIARTGYRYVALNRAISGQHLHTIHSWLIYRFL